MTYFVNVYAPGFAGHFWYTSRASADRASHPPVVKRVGVLRVRLK